MKPSGATFFKLLSKWPSSSRSSSPDLITSQGETRFEAVLNEGEKAAHHDHSQFNEEDEIAAFVTEVQHRLGFSLHREQWEEMLSRFVSLWTSISNQEGISLPTVVEKEMARWLAEDTAMSHFWEWLQQLPSQEQHHVLRLAVHLFAGESRDGSGSDQTQPPLSASGVEPAEGARREHSAERLTAVLITEDKAPILSERSTPAMVMMKGNGGVTGERSSPLPGAESIPGSMITKGGDVANERLSSSSILPRSWENAEKGPDVASNGKAGVRPHLAGGHSLTSASSKTEPLIVMPHLLASDETASSDGMMPAKAQARPAPGQPRSFVDAFRQYVVRQLHVSPNGVSEARLSLYPESLGQVDVRIFSHNGSLTAHLIAETWLAKELLEGQLDQLRQALQSHGLQANRLEVSIGQQETPMRQFFHHHAHGHNGGNRPKQEQSAMAGDPTEGYLQYDSSQAEEWRNPHASINYTV